MINQTNLEFYKIKEFWINELISASKDILDKLSAKEISVLKTFDFDKEAIMVSFNKNWEPFIGHTHGFNKPDERIFFKNPLPQVLLKIRNNFQKQGRQFPGGRIFIERNSVFFIYQHKKKNTLLIIEYSNTRDIAKEFKKMLNSLRLDKAMDLFAFRNMKNG